MAIGTTAAAIDGRRRRAYYRLLMRGFLSRVIAIATVVFGSAFFAEAEDLDAALEAQKKKAARRVYSEKAQIENLDFLIPKPQSEEEKALDRELEKLESQLTTQIVPPRSTPAPRMRVPVPEKEENWLTPSQLDPEAEGLSVEKDAPSWVELELERQQAIQEQKKAIAEEEAIVNKMLREDSRQSYSVEEEPPKSYESMLRHTVTPGVTPSASGGVLVDPLASLRPKEEKTDSSSDVLFSPAARANSGVIRPTSPLSTPQPQTPSWKPQFGSSAPTTTSSDFTSDWNVKPKPLTPLKRVRKSLPINRKDPFTEDFMPEIKTSIWD